MTASTLTAVEPYQIKFQHRNQYLYFRVKSETSDYDVMLQYWQAIAQKSAEYDCSRILLEKDVPAANSLADIFHIVEELRVIGLSRSRLAIADKYPEHREMNEFAELVASNRGIRMRIFTSVDDAERWLMSAR